MGFEQIEIEFDLAWLGRGSLPTVPVMQLIGGLADAEGRSLWQACAEASETGLRAAAQRFLKRAGRQPQRQPASWIGAITRRLCEDTTLRVADLAREASRHPSWVGAAYRQATGEGLQETAARFRVQCAARLLRETNQTYASIVQEAGFCDQSHMNRTFRRVLARSPAAVLEKSDETFASSAASLAR